MHKDSLLAVSSDTQAYIFALECRRQLTFRTSVTRLNVERYNVRLRPPEIFNPKIFFNYGSMGWGRSRVSYVRFSFLNDFRHRLDRLRDLVSFRPLCFFGSEIQLP